jgi:D-lactate dehydrogenase (cytochrome)
VEAPADAAPRSLRGLPAFGTCAWDLDKKMVARALLLGGSSSGEHGVGIGKREFLEQEHGAEALAVMRSVKQALDPRGFSIRGRFS